MKKPKIKLYCGDCLEVMKKIPNESIDCVLTDPPYGMAFQSNHRKKKYDKIDNDLNLNWLSACVNELYRIAKNNTAHYAFCSFHNVDVYKQEFSKRFTVKNILVWIKNNTSMGDLTGNFAPKYEFILFMHKGRSKIRGARDSNVLFFNRTGNKIHPTQKPIDLLEYLAEKFSDTGDVIFDPFMGSGSTGVACVNTNRNFIGIEKDKKYFEIAKKRIAEAVRGTA